MVKQTLHRHDIAIATKRYFMFETTHPNYTAHTCTYSEPKFLEAETWIHKTSAFLKALMFQ